MNWYLAKLIFSVKTGNGNHTPQFDIQLRLINACGQHEALQKARSVGNEEEEIFLSEPGEIVRWIFVDVAELTALPSFRDGMELYSQIEEKEEAASFIHLIRDKAANLEKQSNITFA